MDTQNELFKIDPKIKVDKLDIVLKETMNIDVLKYFVMNSDKYDLGGGYRYNTLDAKASITMMNDTISKIQDGVLENHYSQTTYLEGPHSKSYTFGRYTSNKYGFQSMKKHVRNCLCKDNYIDVDMVCAHVTILSWYCRQLGLDTSAIDYYANNSKECRKEMAEMYDVPISEVKQDLLSILNNGSTAKTKYEDPPDWFLNYIHNVEDVITKLCEMHPKLYKIAEFKKKSKCKKGEKPFNVEGSCVNFIMVNYENVALQCIVKVLQESGIGIGALVFDGLLVERQDDMDSFNDVLKICERRISDVLPGLNMKLIVKEYEDMYDLSDVPDESFQACSAWYDKDIKNTAERQEICGRLLSGTDLAFAECLYKVCEENIVVTTNKDGFIYDKVSCLWNKSPASSIFNLGLPVLQEIMKGKLEDLEIKLRTDETYRDMYKEQIKVVKKVLKTLESSSIVNKIFERLSAVCLDNEFENKLNSEYLHLFPVMNGKVVDLRTGEVHLRTKEHMFTWEAPIDMDVESEQCDIDLANKFFVDLANNDEDLASYIKKLFLYFLSGETFDRGFYQLIGVGCNGKSSFTNLLECLLPSMCIPGQRKCVVRDPKHPGNGSGPQPGITLMRNKRLVIFSETEDSDVIDSGSVKMLTGGDRIQARNLYSNDMQEFYMTGKLLISTNNPLRLYNADKAVKDRSRFLPFNNIFEKNVAFMANLKTSRMLTALFRVALKEGMESMVKMDISMPNVVSRFTDDIFTEDDVVGCFLSEYYTVCDLNESKISSTTMYNLFRDYCTDAVGIKNPMSQNLFSRKMKAKGYEPVKMTDGRYFKGFKDKQVDVVVDERPRLLYSEGRPPM